MRFITTLLLGTALALPAMAQTTKSPTAPMTMHKTRPHHTMARTGHPGRPTENDKGPFTPEANRAYNGGGAILEGAPGGPRPPASSVLQQPQGQPLPPPQL